MSMEKILRILFDFQKYERDPKLSTVIEDSRKKQDNINRGVFSIGDDALDLVNAAGDHLPEQNGQDKNKLALPPRIDT